MHLKSKAILALGLTLICLSGCGKEKPPVPSTAPHETAFPTAPVVETTSPYEVESLKIVVTESDIRQLEDYPNLKTLDLTGSDCYAAIARYRKFHPEVSITYTVSLGNSALEVSTAEASLDCSTLDFEKAAENLQYLPNLKSLTLTNLCFNGDQLQQLRETYPKLNLSYTVPLLGEEYDSDTAALDLSAMTGEDVDAVAAGIAMLPKLETLELGSSSLDIPQVKLLTDAAPWARIHYSFSFYGKTLSTTDTRVEFVNTKMEDEAEVRQVLDILPDCTYFKLDNCGFDNETLAGIQEDYPDTKIVWKIHFGKYSAMTDAETIRAVYHVTDENCHDLRYCTSVKYMDIGHNETLTDLSFIGFMPDLEILIASGSAVKDLSGFENCKKLEFLELAYCLDLADISPLAGCESLANLNISYTKVKDLSALDGLPLERLMSIHTWVQDKEQKIFREIHPDCWTTFYYGNQPYGKGWRYDDNGMTYSKIYRKVRDVFGYDDMPQPKIEPKK